MSANSLIGGLFGVLIISIAAAAASISSSALEIEASLSGYNLLWPSQRCCAFKLHLQPDGNAIIVADIHESDHAGVYRREFVVSDAQTNRIRTFLAEIKYFEMPEICCGAIDADVRKLRVRLGSRTRLIGIPEEIAIDAPLQNRRQLEKLQRLWALVTVGAEVPGATIK